MGAARRAFKEGFEAYKGGRFDVAIQQLSEALELQPDYKAAFAYRAICRWTNGDLKGARRDAENVVGVKPQLAFFEALV